MHRPRGRDEDEAGVLRFSPVFLSAAIGSAQGAAFDDQDLIAAAVIDDGEAPHCATGVCPS